MQLFVGIVYSLFKIPLQVDDVAPTFRLPATRTRPLSYYYILNKHYRLAAHESRWENVCSWSNPEVKPLLLNQQLRVRLSITAVTAPAAHSHTPTNANTFVWPATDVHETAISFRRPNEIWFCLLWFAHSAGPVLFTANKGTDLTAARG